MSEIAGAWVDWGYDPETDIRILWIPSPIDEVVVQDILDTCRAIEDELDALDKPALIDRSGGEEDLTGGIFNALTVTLSNLQVAFEARDIVEESGSVTTPSAAGTELHDSTAQLITNGVRRGSIITNEVDNSWATVLQVVSETFLRCTALSGGTDNQFDLTDTYTINRVVKCTIGGGNLVSRDYLGASIDDTLPTFGTQIVKSASSSATLIESDGQSIVFQSYSFDPIQDRLTGMVWVERNGSVVLTPTACSVEFMDEDDNVLFTLTDANADTHGYFKVQKPAPGLSPNRLYHATATVLLPNATPVSGGKGAFTVAVS